MADLRAIRIQRTDAAMNKESALWRLLQDGTLEMWPSIRGRSMALLARGHRMLVAARRGAASALTRREPAGGTPRSGTLAVHLGAGVPGPAGR